MRISDWSSDVCSSDLAHAVVAGGEIGRAEHAELLGVDGEPAAVDDHRHHGAGAGLLENVLVLAALRAREQPYRHLAVGTLRSAEHTSELQSLMRTSYAVFCLINKITVTILNFNPNSRK